MDHDDAVERAAGYAAHHSETSLQHLLRCLDIERTDPAWRARLAPFAPVWAAMIAAAAAGHATLARDRRAGTERG